MRIFWFYYKSLLPIAVVFTFILGALFTGLGNEGESITLDFRYLTVKKYLLLYSTFGFSLAGLLDLYFYKNKKFMYYNLGYSRRRIFITLSLINLVFTTIICLWI